MPYTVDDPRSQLSTAAPTPGVPRQATCRSLLVSSPDETHPCGSRTWWTRSQALVISYTEALVGDELSLADITGESMVLFLAGARAELTCAERTAVIDADSVVVVPSGSNRIVVTEPGTVVRIVAAVTSRVLAGACANSGDYATADVNVATFSNWRVPEPAILVYPIEQYQKIDGVLGRIFRCSTIMVNVFEPEFEPRDPTKLSPHHHDDFEQISLQIDGDYVHHFRTPWTPDSSTWRDDEHAACASPAVVVIPPFLVHTSQSVGQMRHWLIDVFGPPRLDFSQRPGWVRNADDFPMP